jgi:DNA-binding MarR family transcriptional regulator
VLLWQREALTVREIIEQLHLDYGTVSPLLKRLESRGLVKGSSQDKPKTRNTRSLSVSGMS